MTYVKLAPCLSLDKIMWKSFKCIKFGEDIIIACLSVGTANVLTDPLRLSSYKSSKILVYVFVTAILDCSYS